MLALNIERQTPTPHSETSGITEITLSNSGENGHEIVLPMLAHLSRQAGDKWFTWVAPVGIDRNILEQYGFDLSRVRLVHTRNEEETLWVLWDALSNGTSGTVVASMDWLGKHDRDKLEHAAQKGSTTGLVLKYR